MSKIGRKWRSPPAASRRRRARVVRWLCVSVWLLAGGLPLFARTATATGEPMRIIHTDAVWHTIHVLPAPGVPKIHTLDKLNPVWWLENTDDATPPAWYLSRDRHRALKWRFRNPLHNFDHYVIGLADKEFSRSGLYPERNSNPHGGWDIEIARRRLVVLPFVAFERPWCDFYFGWREHGAFGIKLIFPKQAKKPTRSHLNTKYNDK